MILTMNRVNRGTHMAYDALLSGATFDDTLFTLAENLRELEKEPLPWLAVMSRATLDIPI